MADLKISQLTAATTPVAGTEVLPIVQSGATVQLSISNLTPGLNTIAATKGGTGLTSFTANGIVYAATTTTLATGSGFTFDGTNVASTGTITGTKLIPTGSSVTGNGVYLPAANSVGISTNGVNALLLDSNQNLFLGTTTSLGASTRFSLKGGATQAAGIIQIGTDGYPGLSFNNASAVQQGYIQINTSTVLYVSVSDYRLKNTVVPMVGALAKVVALKPVTYKWNVDGSVGQGFIAHELQSVVPECVSGEKDAVDENGNPKYQGIDTSFLVATLTAAIQEQQTIIESFATRLAALESK